MIFLAMDGFSISYINNLFSIEDCGGLTQSVVIANESTIVLFLLGIHFMLNYSNFAIRSHTLDL